MSPEEISKVFIFSSNEEELTEIEKIIRIRIYNKGETIFFDTEPYNGFYIVLKGLVKDIQDIKGC